MPELEGLDISVLTEEDASWLERPFGEMRLVRWCSA